MPIRQCRSSRRDSGNTSSRSEALTSGAICTHSARVTPSAHERRQRECGLLTHELGIAITSIHSDRASGRHALTRLLADAARREASVVLAGTLNRLVRIISAASRIAAHLRDEGVTIHHSAIHSDARREGCDWPPAPGDFHTRPLQRGHASSDMLPRAMKSRRLLLGTWARICDTWFDLLHDLLSMVVVWRHE